MYANNSDITIANGGISGVIAIRAERSRFDIAGAQLSDTRDAVKAAGSKFIFSVSRAHGRDMDGPLHLCK